MQVPARPSTLALVALALLVAPGCRDTGPTGSFPPPATIESLWPNDDGRYWTYRMRYQEGVIGSPTYFPTRADVPPAPSLDEVEELLRQNPISPGPGIRTYQLQFEGMFTTASGATGQRLKETYFFPGALAPAALRSPGGFLPSLAIARPDLRGRLAKLAAAPDRTDESRIGPRPLFLFGYAWRLTPDWIGSYGDADTLLAWKYLAADLTPGSEFTHRLVPSLADDVFLHARILPRRTVSTPVGPYPDVVECLYEVDYGIATVVDVADHVIGYYRSFSYGRIAYAIGVGPVASTERDLVDVAKPDAHGWWEISLGLTDTGSAVLARAH